VYVDPETYVDIDHVIACIDQVKTVIICLLGDSDAFREAQNFGLDVTPQRWPLPPVVHAGLLMTTFLLDQYAERLMLNRRR
jgi:hypothetical protein